MPRAMYLSLPKELQSWYYVGAAIEWVRSGSELTGGLSSAGLVTHDRYETVVGYYRGRAGADDLEREQRASSHSEFMLIAEGCVVHVLGLRPTLIVISLHVGRFLMPAGPLPPPPPGDLTECVAPRGAPTNGSLADQRRGTTPLDSSA